MDEQQMETTNPQQPVRRKRGRPSLRTYQQVKDERTAELEAKQPETEVRQEKGGPMMINISRPIRDQNGQVWHRKRRWVVLTPAVCQVVDCGFDFLAENKLPKWDELTAAEQDMVLRGMATHALSHEHERSRMVTAGEYEEIQKQGWPPPAASRIPAVLKTK